MTYVDGFVLVVPKNKLTEYKKMAIDAGKIWMKHGALEYVECVGNDLDAPKDCGHMTFNELAKPKNDELVFYSFIIYRNKKHRDSVNKKVFKDPAMDENIWKDKPMPFDMKKMAWGGFESIVDMVRK